MLAGLIGWLHRRREKRAERASQEGRAKLAGSQAESAFADAYPDRQVLPRRARVEVVADGHIVTLQHGSTRPPGRSWWHVDRAGAVAELPHDEAAKRIDIPPWR